MPDRQNLAYHTIFRREGIRIIDNPSKTPHGKPWVEEYAGVIGQVRSRIVGKQQEKKTSIKRQTATTMSSPPLLPELLDIVTDHLHDTEDALRNCCLVSKSWILRTRRHLFAEVRFESRKYVESWKEIFPDPSTSAGHYTKSLLINFHRGVTAADAEPGGWIRGFSQVEHFELGCYDGLRFITPLLPFHGFSPVIKSLEVKFVALPPSQVFDLILSFPHLEGFTVINSYDMPDKGDSDRLPPATQPPNPARFTGSLSLLMMAGMGSIARRLLSMPGGLHFRELTLMWVEEEDIPLTSGLVEMCSNTIETLDITCDPNGMSIRYVRLRQ